MSAPPVPDPALTSHVFGPTILVGRDGVARSVTISDAIHVVENVFHAHGRGRVAMPPKITLDLRQLNLDVRHRAMPGFVEEYGAAGMKWIGAYPKNRERGLPFITGLVILQDPATGYPLAIIEAGQLTVLRTGAVVGVCAKYYARKDSSRIALVGAGEQARSAWAALAAEFAVDEVRIYDKRPEKANALAESQAGALPGVRVCSTAEEAVRGSDIVVTATHSDGPLVRAEYLQRGCTIISIGSFQELADDAVLTADKLVVDSWEQCADHGELARFVKSSRLTRTDIFAEVGETVAGLRPGRELEEEIIVVVPLGLGTHDVALARLVYERLVADPPASFRFI